MAAECEKVSDEIAKLKADFETRIDALAAEIAKMQQREPVKGYTDFLRILDRPRDDAAWSQTRRRAQLARRIDVCELRDLAAEI